MSMNCFDARQNFQQVGLDPTRASHEVREHLQACDLCAQWRFGELLQHTLAEDDCPEPTEAQVDQLIGNAIARGERQQVRRYSIVAGLAVVGLALAMVVANPIFRSNSGPDYEVAMVPYTSEFVEFIINSTNDREVATVTIELAENLELEGFPDHHTVSWETPLVKGKNLLRLPVLLKDDQDSELNIGLSYGSTTRELTIMVKANQSIPPRAALSA